MPLSTPVGMSWDRASAAYVWVCAALAFRLASIKHVQGGEHVGVVMVARLQSLIGTDHPDAAPNWGDIGIFEKVRLAPDVGVVEIGRPGGDRRSQACVSRLMIME
jgi:hypothetical protein